MPHLRHVFSNQNNIHVHFMIQYDHKNNTNLVAVDYRDAVAAPWCPGGHRVPAVPPPAAAGHAPGGGRHAEGDGAIVPLW